MENNTNKLGDIIKEIVEAQKFEKLQQIYIVDKQTGPYKRIQEAIDSAQPNSLIKISEGLYDELLTINKPLTIQPKVYNNPNVKENTGVILLVSTGHALTIDIPNDHKDPSGQNVPSCIIRGLKISHSGNTSAEVYENQLLENESIMRLFQKKQIQTYSLENEYITKAKIDNIENTIVHVKRGKLMLEASLLSLSYIVKSCRNTIPAVFVADEGSLAMMKCEVKGNSEHETIGIMSKLGRVDIRNSKISMHKGGGVLMWGLRANSSRLIKNLIEDCSVGVQMVGEENNTLVMHNTITRCDIGVKVGLGVMCQISNNMIFQNRNGVEVHSGFAQILKNRIEKNTEEGVLLKCHKRLKCEAYVKRNYSIVGNKANGIRIEGSNNTSKVSQNHLIGFNSLSGIKILNEANPHILMNKIYKNLSEGILVVQNSSAIIQKNDISHNIRMNIGLGGERSNNTMIIQNKISNSKGQGIFMVECSKAMVARNDVVQNNDGIVAITSVPIIKRNYISKNRSNGVLLLKDSQAEIKENLVCENEAVGFYFRDRCFGEVDSNVVNGNEIDVAFERVDYRSKEIAVSNTVSGEIRIPKQVGCIIM